MKLISIFVVTIFVAFQALAAEDFTGIGSWDPSGTAFIAVDGKMDISAHSITWSKHGTVGTTKIASRADSQVVELAKKVDCGKYLRIGPRSIDSGTEYLEVAFYSNRSEAVSPKVKGADLVEPKRVAYRNGCSSGSYERPAKKQ